MKKSILSVALFIIVLSSCQNNSKQVNQKDAVVRDTVVRHEEEHAQQENPVTLNNGEKWAANAETTDGINKMTALISEFTPEPKQDNYRSLKVNLESEFNQIIQKCTMTGEAHEQLHRYLIPMTEMIKQLSSDDTQICRVAFENLKQHLVEYENYFK